MELAPREIAEYQNDHDLLIRLDEKFDGLIKKVDGLTDDHERRLRALERQKWMFAGGAAVLSVLATFLLQRIFS